MAEQQKRVYRDAINRELPAFVEVATSQYTEEGEKIRNILEMILRDQELLQNNAFGKDYNYGDDWEKFHTLLDLNFNAIIHELTELRDWSNWKSWRKSYHQQVVPNDLGEMKMEAIDVLFFLLNIFILLDMDAREIVRLYYAKLMVNTERQEKGY